MPHSNVRAKQIRPFPSLGGHAPGVLEESESEIKNVVPVDIVYKKGGFAR